ncbi:electron transfer flavoprotein subunit alpha/FixB family protein [Basilea psittacipulmonis]|uniref:Electron transfer flavoprotein subunit alpha n=1 Tax=Basilea psittacipulmonis DSM 24701 TaxID=1072685 RepID=A0A077DC85_9BURK|nr:electron transfer flavoprotein subunit alpha/FixB family protein [Basilea psittacipulmonis]AIL32500.1 electron transfer flavoprotein subunit beta [Basilea psittacipulmonis DSM 24701]
MRTLVIAEFEKDQISSATLHCVTAAKQIAAECDVLLMGHQLSALSQQVAAIEGVSKVFVVDHENFQHRLAEQVSAQILEFLKQNASYTHIVFASSSFGKNIAPRVAAKLDVAQISDVTKVITAQEFEHPIYAGNVIETVQTTDSKVVLTVRTTAFTKAGLNGQASVEHVSAISPVRSATFVSQHIPVSDRPDLSAAKVVLSGGRALGSAEQFNAVLTPLANVLNAAIGASRAAVDAGYAPNDLQVGQTGKIVAPELYIAVGISGAIQHIAGMKDSGFIVAINKDPDAPIFNIADVGLVADLFEAVPALTQALSS